MVIFALVLWAPPSQGCQSCFLRNGPLCVRFKPSDDSALVGGGRMKLCYLFLLIATFLFCLTETSAAQTTMEPWLTRSADNSRSAWNPRERQLTQGSVANWGIIRAT